jgi:hypothetical protein
MVIIVPTLTNLTAWIRYLEKSFHKIKTLRI